MQVKKINNANSASALSIDVEDGLNILMHDIFKVNMSPTKRVINNVNILLDLFSEHNVKSTMFILGEIAVEYPDLVRKMASYGHEIGVHGYYHDQIFKLTPQKAKKHIYKAKALLEEVTGQPVYGFRAPAFSIFEETKWCLEVLADLGFKYDSSIVPAKGKRYGWPEIDKDIHKLKLSEEKSIIEVPLSVTNFMGKTVPACGGGYLRYFPYCFTKQAFKTINKERPVIVYLHPYELDTGKYPDFFYESLASLPLKRRLPLQMYRFNKGTVHRKLSNLIKEFNFKPIIEIIKEAEEHRELPVNQIN